ncbi:MAG: hypothetical protein ACR2HC_06480 [Thermoleophilaceae bacterium]
MQLKDAYQQQLGHWRAALDSGAHRIGWKIGFNPPAVQEKLGLSEPVVGHLTSATLLGADGSHSLAGAQAPKVEPEIAIEVGPGNAIAGLAAAIEIVDIPAMPDGLEEAGEAVAANIFHRGVAIGSSKPIESAQGISAALTINGEAVGTADAGAADLQEIVALAARTLEAAGESLGAGDRIIAGALLPPPDVKPGDRVSLDLGAIGAIQISFVT